MKLKNKKIVVIGLGKSGFSTLKVLVKNEANTVVMDIKDERELPTQYIKYIRKKKITLISGGYDKNLLDEADLIVLSPGVPTNLPVLRNFKEKVIGEIELGFQINPNCFIIAITGTNGKTTTTTLIGEILKKDKRHPKVVGNIGYPFIEEAAKLKKEIMVIEVSSFQLETIKKFKPKISVILNITPDHYDRHKRRDYFDLKKRIFLNQNKDDFLILNYDDNIVRSFSKEARARILFFSRKKILERGVYLKEKNIVDNLTGNERIICSREDLRRELNLENILASISTALLMNVKLNNLVEVLRNFKGLPHRQEEIGEIRGVKFVNDSKGTNPDSTIKALESFTSPIILIAGGSEKKLNFSKLVKIIKNKVKYLFLIGETKDRIEKECLKVGFSKLKKVTNLKEAVELGWRKAKEGDVILLSPACASFDMFQNYEERGEIFKREFEKLKNNEMVK